MTEQLMIDGPLHEPINEYRWRVYGLKRMEDALCPKQSDIVTFDNKANRAEEVGAACVGDSDTHVQVILQWRPDGQRQTLVQATKYIFRDKAWAGLEPDKYDELLAQYGTRESIPYIIADGLWVPDYAHEGVLRAARRDTDFYSAAPASSEV